MPEKITITCTQHSLREFAANMNDVRLMRVYTAHRKRALAPPTTNERRSLRRWAMVVRQEVHKRGLGS